MKNLIHRIAKTAALVLISALPMSIAVCAEEAQNSKNAAEEVKLDDEPRHEIGPNANKPG